MLCIHHEFTTNSLFLSDKTSTLMKINLRYFYKPLTKKKFNVTENACKKAIKVKIVIFLILFYKLSKIIFKIMHLFTHVIHVPPKTKFRYNSFIYQRPLCPQFSLKFCIFNVTFSIISCILIRTLPSKYKAALHESDDISV